MTLNPTPRWLISDTHLGHDNILIYESIRTAWCRTVEEMDERIIAEWNARVQPDDWVLHCGDFSFGPKETITEFRRRLNGKILLVVGNHDRSPKVMGALGMDVSVKRFEFELEGRRYVARHNPASFTVEEAERADVLLHGHLHSNPIPTLIDPRVRARCVCLSLERLPAPPAPVSWEELQGLGPLAG